MKNVGLLALEGQAARESALRVARCLERETEFAPAELAATYAEVAGRLRAAVAAGSRPSDRRGT
jgi:hypothetical protein